MQNLIQRVADVEHRYIDLPRQTLQIRQQFTLARDVERSQRLIEQQQLGRGQQCATNRHTLFFTAGQTARQAIEQRLNAQQRDQFIKLLRHAFRHTVTQITAHFVVREQACILKHIADTTLLRRQADTLLNIVQHASVKHNPPLLRRSQAADGID